MNIQLIEKPILSYQVVPVNVIQTVIIACGLRKALDGLLPSVVFAIDTKILFNFFAPSGDFKKWQCIIVEVLPSSCRKTHHYDMTCRIR